MNFGIATFRVEFATLSYERSSQKVDTGISDQKSQDHAQSDPHMSILTKQSIGT